MRTLYVGDNKVLWVTEVQQPLHVTATSLDVPDAAFSVAFSHALDQPASHPSSLTFSASGCWQLHASAGDTTQEIVVYVFPEQYLPRLIDDQFVTLTALRFPAEDERQPPQPSQGLVAVDLLIESAVGDRDVMPWRVLAPMVFLGDDGTSYPLLHAEVVDSDPHTDLSTLALAPGESLRVRALFAVPGEPVGMHVLIQAADGQVQAIPVTELSPP